jgi:hypothetical protein
LLGSASPTRPVSPSPSRGSSRSEYTPIPSGRGTREETCKCCLLL